MLVMLQIGSYQNNHLIIKSNFKHLCVKAGLSSLPFAIFISKNKEKMSKRESYGTSPPT